MAPAMRWMALSALVPRGISECESALKAAAMEGTIVAPIPIPITSSAADRYR
jgi:hypothetical protein